jgi:hypothetical protein
MHEFFVLPYSLRQYLIGVTRFCGHSILDTTRYPDLRCKHFVSETLKIKLNKKLLSKVVSFTYKMSFTYEQEYINPYKCFKVYRRDMRALETEMAAAMI